MWRKLSVVNNVSQVIRFPLKLCLCSVQTTLSPLLPFPRLTYKSLINTNKSQPGVVVSAAATDDNFIGIEKFRENELVAIFRADW